MAWLAVLGMVLSISGEGTTRIVGSGTVAPLAEIVRQRMNPALEARLTIEPTGSNRGFTLFCGSTDPEIAPLTLASRAFGKAEVQACEQSLSAEVSEHIVGLNGLILVTNRRGPLAGADLTRTDLFLAFAENIPDTNCTVKKNDKQLWSDVRADLPAEPIEMFGPGETSGTFSSFLDLAMVPGAAAHPCASVIASKDLKRLRKLAKSLRSDVWHLAPENDVEVVAHLPRQPATIGVVGYANALRFGRHVEMLTVEGHKGEPATFADRSYPLAGRLYVYSNDQALAENEVAQAFFHALTSEEATGTDGYLKRYGLIPIP